LSVATEHGSVTIESSTAPVLVDVPPQSSVAINGSHPNIPRLERNVDAPFAGQTLDVVIPIELVTRPSLVVRLPGATQAGIERLRLRLEPIEPGLPTELSATAEKASDTFRVAVVPVDPGDYLLVLEPNERSGAGHFIGPKVARLQLPAAGEAHADFELDLFGRCRVDISSSDSKSLSATYRLIDGEGCAYLERNFILDAPREVADMGDGHFIWESSAMELHLTSFSGASSQSSPASAARRCGVVPAGEYTLEVESSAYQPYTRAVVVKVGETTTVSVKLEPLSAATR
jgi:hypothetical protein